MLFFFLWPLEMCEHLFPESCQFYRLQNVFLKELGITSLKFLTKIESLMLEQIFVDLATTPFVHTSHWSTACWYDAGLGHSLAPAILLSPLRWASRFVLQLILHGMQQHGNTINSSPCPAWVLFSLALSLLPFLNSALEDPLLVYLISTDFQFPVHNHVWESCTPIMMDLRINWHRYMP